MIRIFKLIQESNNTHLTLVTCLNQRSMLCSLSLTTAAINMNKMRPLSYVYAKLSSVQMFCVGVHHKYPPNHQLVVEVGLEVQRNLLLTKS